MRFFFVLLLVCCPHGKHRTLSPARTPPHRRGTRTYRQLGDLTETNHETVRRYMLGQAPSAEFLAATCAALDINAQWLLVGRGPMKGTDIRAHALGEANVSELLSAMSATLERLMDRVDRLEVYMQTLETHLRAQSGDPSGLAGDPTTLKASRELFAKNPPLPGGTSAAAGSAHEKAAAPQDAQDRAARIAGSLPQRPRPNAG